MAAFFVQSLSVGLRGGVGVKDVGRDRTDLFPANEIEVFGFNAVTFSRRELFDRSAVTASEDDGPPFFKGTHRLQTRLGDDFYVA